MNFALDIVLFCIIAVFTLVGVRRGLVRALVHFVGSVIALFISSAVGGVIAQWIFDTMFKNALVERINETVEGMGAAEAVQGFLASLPEFLLGALSIAGISVNTLTYEVAKSQGEIADTIAEIISPVFVSFIKVFVVTVLFMLLIMVVRVVASYVGRIFRIPILRQINGLFGGVFGLLLAVIMIWVVLSAVGVFVPLMAIQAQETWNDSINDSFIAGTLYSFNPFENMFT